MVKLSDIRGKSFSLTELATIAEIPDGLGDWARRVLEGTLLPQFGALIREMAEGGRTMETCPRCGAPLPPETYLEELATVPGRLPAYRLRHKKENGRMCVAYVGAEVGHSEGGGAEALPARGSVRRAPQRRDFPSPTPSG